MPLKNVEKKKSNQQSLNFRNSASTVSIDGYHKTLLDIINCQKSGLRRKSVVLILDYASDLSIFWKKTATPGYGVFGEFTLV